MEEFFLVFRREKGIFAVIMASIITRHIPNAVTSCNLLSGCIATAYATQADYKTAFLFIILGAIFDFCDGLAARAFHAYSSIGKELDSLADDITFGLAPSMMIYQLLNECAKAQYGENSSTLIRLIPYAAFLIAVFSALRLAKFNIDERQTSSFIGLPTPANALFWGALCIGKHEAIVNAPWGIWIIIFLIFLFSWLLISEIPMFSLKIHCLQWKDNKTRYIFLIVSVILIVILGLTGFSAIIGWYIVLSLLTNRPETESKKTS